MGHFQNGRLQKDDKQKSVLVQLYGKYFVMWANHTHSNRSVLIDFIWDALIYGPFSKYKKVESKLL